VIWAVRIPEDIRDISVSEEIYAANSGGVVKLNRDGEPEWSVTLESAEKLKMRSEVPEDKRVAAEKGGVELPEFYEYETERYKTHVFSIHADDFVYVAGLIHDEWNDQVHPFLAKLSSDGEIVWAKKVNVTYSTPDFYVLSGKLMRNGATFIAWISRCFLFTFDENGRILNFYVLNGEIGECRAGG